MWKSFKFTTFLFILLFLVFFLFFKDSLLNIGHMTAIRVLRGAVFTWISLVLLQKILDFSFLNQHSQKKKWIFSLILSAAWIALYTFVFSRTDHALSHDIGNYYIIPCLLFAVTLISSCLFSRLPKAFRAVCTILFSIILFSIFLCAIFYAIYDCIYGQPFDEYALLSVLATNPDEIVNYVTSTFSLVQASLIILFLAGLFICLIRTIWKITSIPYTPVIHKKSFAVVSLLILYFFMNYMATVFPVDQILHLQRKDGPMNVFIQLENNIAGNERHLVLDDENKTLARNLPGTVIMVIGESANRDRMSAFSETSRNTTPWEKEKSQDNNFVFFDKAYSNFPNTVMAVTEALTNSNQYNAVPLSNSIDILTVAKKAGYHTYWFSLQNKSTVSDAGITVLAKQADTLKWLKGYDENVLKELKTVPQGQNNFIIIHLSGSHFNYDRRVPDWFLEQYNLTKGSKETNYDNSLQYTDYVLQQIFAYSMQHLNLQAMIYFSDHSENMQYTHTTSPFTFDMVHIPFWVYLSPDYIHQYPSTAQTLRNNRQNIFTNDTIFETVSGIIQAPSNVYDARYDISSPSYSLTPDQALTIQGKRHISEDL